MPPLDVLFIHTNFPGQFRSLAEHLRSQPNIRVRAIASTTAGSVPGVEAQRYSVAAGPSTAVHSFARRFDQECRRAEQVIYAANALKVQGFDPHLIYVHPGWGEALPLRALFPHAVIATYAEFYFRPRGIDVGFDSEFGQFGVDGETRVTLRNASNLLALADADFAVAPTHWQRSVFPTEFQHKIHVVHDGVDTDALAPLKGAQGRREEILTYVARNLEPYRGFHVFMRALPQVLKERPKAQVYIVGGDRISYGSPPSGGGTWREAMLQEVGEDLDLSRVHFTGTLSHEAYVALLRRSRVHAYLTYPFVLSWSMLEAMSLGCLVVGSDTGPVTEVIEDGVNGYLVPFGDPAAIADRLIEALAQPARGDRLRRAARETIVDRYDLARVALPGHEELIERHLARGSLMRPRWSRESVLHRTVLDAAQEELL
jgi:glycosyltransferase involved in cell wall biosynthesis